MNNESSSPVCPKCQYEYPYADGALWVCAECAHEWDPTASHADDSVKEGPTVVRDSCGNILKDGDAITVVKDLKVKGSSLVVKVGAKAKNIKLVDGNDGHDIACKIEGIGAINLKSEFVKKV